MGVPTSEVGYTSATARRGDHESSYEHVVALGKKNVCMYTCMHVRMREEVRTRRHAQNALPLRGFRLPPRRKKDLRSSAMLRSVQW